MRGLVIFLVTIWGAVFTLPLLVLGVIIIHMPMPDKWALRLLSDLAGFCFLRKLIFVRGANNKVHIELPNGEILRGPGQ